MKFSPRPAISKVIIGNTRVIIMLRIYAHFLMKHNKIRLTKIGNSL